VTDHQQPPIGADRRQRPKRVGAVEAGGKRGMLLQQPPLILLPRLGSQFGGLASARLRAEQDRLEGRLQARQRDAGGACLLLAARRQAPRGVRARSVRLGLGMP